MGLFDFLKGTGNKLFSKDEEAAKKIEEHIQAYNPGVENLRVEYKKPKVFLYGTAGSPEAVQKAVLMAGNIQGVESVNVDGVMISSQPASAGEVESHENTQYYIIQSGDTLS